MNLVVIWLRMPFGIVMLFLRLFSFFALMGVLAGVLMQTPVMKFVCFVVCPIVSFLLHMLAGKISRALYGP